MSSMMLIILAVWFVALFSGAVLELSRKAGIASPVNQMLFDRITAMEAEYAR